MGMSGPVKQDLLFLDHLREFVSLMDYLQGLSETTPDGKHSVSKKKGAED